MVTTILLIAFIAGALVTGLLLHNRKLYYEARIYQRAHEQMEFAYEAERKTCDELRQLHTDAIKENSRLKRQLTFATGTEVLGKTRVFDYHRYKRDEWQESLSAGGVRGLDVSRTRERRLGQR